MKPTSSRRFKRKIAEVVALCALILSIIALILTKVHFLPRTLSFHGMKPDTK